MCRFPKIAKNSHSNVRRRKVDVVRDFPEHCGPVAPVLTRESNGMELMNSNEVQCAPDYVATDVRKDGERRLASHDNCKGVGGEIDRDDKSNCRSFGEKFKQDCKTLSLVLAGAMEYLKSLGINYPSSKDAFALGDSKCIIEGKISTNPSKGKRREREENLDEFVMSDRSGGLLSSGKRMKVDYINNRVLEKEKSSKCVSNMENNGGEINLLSSEEWKKFDISSKHVHDSDEVKRVKKVESAPKMSTLKNFSRECYKTGHGVKITDLEDACYASSSSDHDCDATGKQEQEYFMDLVEFKSVDGKEPDDSSREKLTIVEYSDIRLKYIDNHVKLVNLEISQQDQPQRTKVKELLKLFKNQNEELLLEDKAETVGQYMKSALNAAELLKTSGNWIYAEKHFGHIPGIIIGDEFRFRAQLMVVGIHRELVSCIDYADLNGKIFATSIINSLCLENNCKVLGTLIFSDRSARPDKAGDQRHGQGTLALKNSMEMGYPIRVVQKRKSLISFKSLGLSCEGSFIYTYDGLYTLNKFWEEKDENGKLSFKFELQRMNGQPTPNKSTALSRDKINCSEICVSDDVSQGRERIPIRAMNAIDDESPSNFHYIKGMVYPNWLERVEPVGCNCIDGCSDSKACSCLIKNNGEFPYNEKGEIVRVRPIVHECGPKCKCPPSCVNRVGQHGQRHELEMFKSKSRGWGVRSRTPITSGSFICEYVGELLREKDAEKRVLCDEYLFDISSDKDGEENEEHGGFTLDGAKFGNIGKYINHSCSPNLYAQKVLYDHGDVRIPHIMFFATRNIRPLQELVYDYNYKIDQVCDDNGNIKKKNCFCGSRKCTGRLY